MSIVLTYTSIVTCYISPEGVTMGREHGTLDPNGNPMNGRWVLRDNGGNLVDFDRYSSDLAERHNLKLVGGE